MNWASLVNIGVALLLPLLPSVVLYRALPSESTVEGPWQGLRIKLGGAFAGYFLLVITVLGFVRTSPAYEIWTVEGQVRFSDNQGVYDSRALTFQPQPSSIVVGPTGRFSVPVLAVPDVSSRMLRLPMLMLDQENYLPSSVNLESEGERDRWSMRIELPDTIVLRADPTAGEGHN